MEATFSEFWPPRMERILYFVFSLSMVHVECTFTVTPLSAALLNHHFSFQNNDCKVPKSSHLYRAPMKNIQVLSTAWSLTSLFIGHPPMKNPRWSLTSLFKYLFLHYVWVFASLYVCTPCEYNPEEEVGSLELQLQIGVSLHVGTGNQTGSSRKAASSLNHWTISPALWPFTYLNVTFSISSHFLFFCRTWINFWEWLF